MKTHRYLTLSALLLMTVTIINSCQDSTDILPADSQDPYMNEAILQIEGIFEQMKVNLPEDARAEWEEPNYSVTVLRCVERPNGETEVLFITRDENDDYIVVTEEQITATLQPGEWMFWSAGEGMEKLIGIEFDQRSRTLLGGDAEEVDQHELWLTRIPQDLPEELLKYDIIYKSENAAGPIRLDPKLEVIEKSEG